MIAFNSEERRIKRNITRERLIENSTLLLIVYFFKNQMKYDIQIFANSGWEVHWHLSYPFFNCLVFSYSKSKIN